MTNNLERATFWRRAEAYIYPNDPKEGPALEVLQERWIGANYNRGFAVCPH